jgi:hypothetical protein
MVVGGEDDCLNLEGGCLTVAVGAENAGRESRVYRMGPDGVVLLNVLVVCI